MGLDLKGFEVAASPVVSCSWYQCGCSSTMPGSAKLNHVLAKVAKYKYFDSND